MQKKSKNVKHGTRGCWLSPLLPLSPPSRVSQVCGPLQGSEAMDRHQERRGRLESRLTVRQFPVTSTRRGRRALLSPNKRLPNRWLLIQWVHGAIVHANTREKDPLTLSAKERQPCFKVTQRPRIAWESDVAAQINLQQRVKQLKGSPRLPVTDWQLYLHAKLQGRGVGWEPVGIRVDWRWAYWREPLWNVKCSLLTDCCVWDPSPPPTPHPSVFTVRVPVHRK